MHLTSYETTVVSNCIQNFKVPSFMPTKSFKIGNWFLQRLCACGCANLVNFVSQYFDCLLKWCATFLS